MNFYNVGTHSSSPCQSQPKIVTNALGYHSSHYVMQINFHAVYYNRILSVIIKMTNFKLFIDSRKYFLEAIFYYLILELHLHPESR